VVVSHLIDKIVLVVRWGATARELVKECVVQLSGHRKMPGSRSTMSTNGSAEIRKNASRITMAALL